MTPDDLLVALDPEQRRVAEALRGPVRVLAGAGSGKTRAITHRIAHGVASGVYAPSEVLAVTFTTRAAGEMRSRLRTLGAGGVQARTFHSAALRQLRYFWPRVHGRELPELTASKLGMLATAARRQRLAPDKALLRDIASEIEWAKVSNVSPDGYAVAAIRRGRQVGDVDPTTVGHVYEAYEEVKRNVGRMDMEDVLLWTAGMLADDERVSAQVRRQYKWFVVDEFQDVSPLQSALLDLWLGGRDEICVVGDPAQTIYSFAGADASYLRTFTERYPQATSVELVRNYRSTPQIVEAANAALAGTVSQGVELRAQRPAGPPIAATGHSDEVAEAAAVAARIAQLIAGGLPAREIAVLTRINAQTENFEDAFADKGVPYVVRGAARFFERPEVRKAVTLLRGAARSGEADGSMLDTVRATLSGLGWTGTPPTSRGQTRDQWESWQALVDQAVAFAAESGHDLGAFVDELDRRAAEQHAPVAEGVTLATLHTAKGLEWDAVFLVGLVEGTMPIIYAKTPAEVEEERRLFYVGLTRAREHLSLSWAYSRNPGGKGNRHRSRFLDSVVGEGDESAGAGTRTPRRKGPAKGRHCRICNRPLTTPAEKKLLRCELCPATYDEELFEELRAWRKARAADDEVPPYVVFSDTTLQLIAEHKPQSDAALLKISGVGPKKVDQYGEELLSLLADS
ncbi:ATP-dependent DNA helicase UvrD2 [Nocardioides jishulii]|uniref:DNA 3'-5' helicase n=1 Tax=Nocardioides jishulii TaxID=2575440 RepID=A0A4V5TK54_9ACTN|nr:ATP-dependent DNA helicase UvrD2 [Nocardioides jishulii]QCX28159.1 ATP-dependent DNA helicase UvrD2 [Nocardioides jishulii]TKI60823.1 ATP-dependent DNA helicase UvrD2 [Nocardioides jishulii]